MKELKEKMMKVAENLNLEGLKELWEKTNRMGRDAGCLALRDVVMTILENRYGEEKFDEWLDTEDFEIFA